MLPGWWSQKHNEEVRRKEVMTERIVTDNVKMRSLHSLSFKVQTLR